VAVLLTVAGLLLGLAAGTAIGLAAGSAVPRAGAAGPPPVTGAAGLSGPPTLYGRVVDIADPDMVVVDVAGQRVPVEVLGIDPSATPTCAAAGALGFARRTLTGQPVTLVPDPTVAPAPVRRAYVVLASQLSYTDAAIRAGWGTPGDSRA